MMTYRSKGVLLAFAIIGPALSQSGNAAEEPGLGTVVPQAEMTMFCQNAAAERFAATLDAVVYSFQGPE